MLFLAIWAPPNGPKMVHGGPQVGRIYEPMSGLEKRPPNQIVRPIFLGEMVQNNQKIVYFMLFLAIWAPPNGPKKVHKGPQVGGMYGTMSELENRP
jgi:hypothetical protein